jgi:diguanylate cyclase (GGDEF)-like protein
MSDTHSPSRTSDVSSAHRALTQLAHLSGSPLPDPLDLLHLAVAAAGAGQGEIVLVDGRNSRWSTVARGGPIDRSAVDEVGCVGLFHDGARIGELVLSWSASASGAMTSSSSSTVAAHLTSASVVAAAQLLALSLASSRLSVMLEAELDDHAHDATHDNLTGLANRVAFEAAIDRALTEVSASLLTSGPVFAAVAVIDLNRFKEINASFGHEVGDAVVAEVAQRLVRSLPIGSTAARIGGDSFAILLSDIVSVDDALEQAETLLTAVTGLIDIEEGALHIDAAMGIALAPLHGITRNVLIRRADVAMYAAKERPESAAAMWAQEQERVTSSELALVADLKRALAHGELAVHYQPKSSIDSGDVVGLEALVRWEHPERGWIAPDELIPLAEHTGLIAEVTTFVLNSALQQCATWHRLGHKLNMAVNIPARALNDVGLPSEVDLALRDVGLDGKWLTLEITETQLTFDSPICRAVMSELRALGVRLAIDDFGTGYSALSYLARFEVDELKIDKSFVLDLAGNAANFAIVRAVVEVAESFGLTTVAEGVEDQGAWDRLSVLGCTTAQGFHLSAPISAEAMTMWLCDRAEPIALTA